jgi:hypothetical protein
MRSPLPDILTGLALSIGAGLVWRDWKGGEMERISRYYKWQEAHRPDKLNTGTKGSDEDDDDD